MNMVLVLIPFHILESDHLLLVCVSKIHQENDVGKHFYRMIILGKMFRVFKAEINAIKMERACFYLLKMCCNLCRTKIMLPYG